jgi:hypothetical protein
MSDYIEVDSHSIKCSDGILKAFAFLESRSGSLKTDNISAESRSSEFKGHSGSGRVFNKESTNCFTFEGRQFFIFARVNFFHHLGYFKDIDNLFSGVIIEIEEISAEQVKVFFHHYSSQFFQIIYNNTIRLISGGFTYGA